MNNTVTDLTLSDRGRVAWIVDGLGWQAPVRPFVILGMNSIAIYMLSEFIEVFLQLAHVRRSIYLSLFAPLASPLNASLLYAIAYTGLMLVMAWVLYRRRIFIKI